MNLVGLVFAHRKPLESLRLSKKIIFNFHKSDHRQIVTCFIYSIRSEIGSLAGLLAQHLFRLLIFLSF